MCQANKFVRDSAYNFGWRPCFFTSELVPLWLPCAIKERINRSLGLVRWSCVVSTVHLRYPEGRTWTESRNRP